MSTPLRALWLAWGAVVALLAYPAGAQIIGQQSGIMGGDSGFLRPVDGGGVISTLTLDAMPYARTVTCGSYTLTGTFTGSVPTWSASPSGESGSCSDTGGGTFSCVVSVAPDATGEGVETITVTNGAIDDVTIGFYVAGAHSCFLSQSVDGNYNSTLADLDPVATWENLGTSALDVTQGTGTAQPTYRTDIVDGQPAVSCDGGDLVTASTASDWTFIANGTTTTTEVVWQQTTASGSFYSPIGTAPLASGGRGFALAMNDSTVNEGHRTYTWTYGSNLIALTTSAADVMPDGAFNLAAMQIAIDVAPAAPDLIQYTNGINTASSDQTFSTSTPTTGLTICASNSGGTGTFPITGYVFRVAIYDGTALDATQRGINQAVDEWALGGTLPVVPPLYHLDSSDSDTITTAGGSVSSWASTGVVTIAATQGTAAQQPASTVSGSSSMVDFDGDNDYVGTASTLTTENRHIFVVATVNSIGSNGVGLSCGQNDGVATFPTYGGIKMRTAGGVAYVVGHNYDGNNDCAETTFTLGQVILEMKVDGTNVSVAVDGGSFVSTASGNTSFASENILIGTGSAGAFFSDVAIHEVLWFSDDLDTAKRNAVIADLQTKWGIP